MYAREENPERTKIFLLAVTEHLALHFTAIGFTNRYYQDLVLVCLEKTAGFQGREAIILLSSQRLWIFVSFDRGLYRPYK